MDVTDLDLEVVLAHVSMAIFRLDADDRFTRFRTGRLKLAVSPELFLGRRIDEVFPEPLASLFLDAAARARATGHASCIEYELDVPGEVEGPHHYVAHIGPGGRIRRARRRRHRKPPHRDRGS